MRLFHAGTEFIRAKFLRDFEGSSSYSANSSVQQTLLVSRLAAHVERAAPQALNVLRYLLAHRDRMVSRAELLAQCWPDSYVSQTTLTSCLWRVRRAIGQNRLGAICGKHAMDHHKERVLAYVFGHRQDEVFQKLKAWLEPLGVA
jgi:hypothetical protein